MVKLKKHIIILKHFVLLLTLIFSLSCSQNKFYIDRIEGKEIKILNSKIKDQKLEQIIQPYKTKIENDLNKNISFSTEDLDKNGVWQCSIGNLLADITYQKSNYIFKKRFNQNIDICLLNYGGIRSIIPKGNISIRNAYEVMPFENSAIVIKLKGDKILNLIEYFITEKKAHPLFGLTFEIDNNNKPFNILIQGQSLKTDHFYHVVTSDYLANGGDKMDFFIQNEGKFELDYKLRNILIDYLSENDTITPIRDIRIKNNK
jgi:2',3'-cyclic-nucleotide 2'-phosphodiesterase (5'-nucleotidase family)